MKKILGTALIFVSATSFVFAQTNENRNERQVRPMMPKNIEQRVENRLDERGVMMTTGDAVIDAQIKTLIQERDQKIKTINDEYATKLKALIGDKKILPTSAFGKRMMDTASGTIRNMIGEVRENENRGDDFRGVNASSTVTASGTVMQINSRQPEIKNFFKNIPFLNKFFSGNEK